MASTTLFPFVLPRDIEAFNALQSELHAAIQPQGVLEQFAFERLVNAAWNMRRVSNAELSLTEKCGGQDPLTHPETANDARRFLALSRQTESSYSRTYKELADLQTARALRNMEDELPPLALSFKIASFLKQTQANRLRDIDIEWKTGDLEIQRLMKASRDLRQSAPESVKTQPVQRVAEQSQPKVETIVRDTPKIGRNEPCPCGSGQKFKRCCGNPLGNSLAHAA